MRQGTDAEARRLADERHALGFTEERVVSALRALIPTAKLIYDWGGNVGISYYTYRQHLDYPEDLIWIVNDLPHVVALGREIAAQEDSRGLQFTTDFEKFENADIVLAGGSLQFIEDPYRIFEKASQRPPHLLFNKVPVYDKEAAVTLHSAGTHFAAYHLFNRDEFVRRFQALGYLLVDTWLNTGLGCRIPFHQEHSIEAYSGFYFRLSEPGR